MTGRRTLPPTPDVADWLACRGLEEGVYAIALTTPRGYEGALEYLQAARRYFATLVAAAEPPSDATARRRARRRLDRAAASVHLPPAKHLQIVAFLALGGSVDDSPEGAQDALLAAADAAVAFFKAGTPARGLKLLEQVLAGELAPDDRAHLQELREVLVVGDAPQVDAALAAVNPTRITAPGPHDERHLVSLAVERLPSVEAAAAELGVTPSRVQQLAKKYGLTTTWPPPAKKAARRGKHAND